MQSPDAPRRVAITGATGYIGRTLVEVLLNDGFEVRTLGRRPLELPRDALSFCHYSTSGQQVDPSIFGGARVLIHLAWDTGAESTSVQSDVHAVERLIAATRAADARLVFVSSQSAAEDAPSEYGRNKWLAEQLALSAGYTVVRPGLVYGGAERGLFGRLCGLAASLPALPFLMPDPQIQVIHVEDLCKALIRIALSTGQTARIYRIAEPLPVGFSVFMGRISTEWLGLRKASLPVPSLVLLALAKAAQSFGPASAAGQLRSLFRVPLMSTSNDLQQIGLELRPLSEGLRMPNWRRRQLLIRESSAILRFILKRPPQLGDVKRLARLCGDSSHPFPLRLPNFAIRCPSLLGAMGTQSTSPDLNRQLLHRRIMTACCVAESSCDGFARFCLVRQTTRLQAAAGLLLAVAKELLLRFLSIAVAFTLPKAKFGSRPNDK